MLSLMGNDAEISMHLFHTKLYTEGAQGCKVMYYRELDVNTHIFVVSKYHDRRPRLTNWYTASSLDQE